MNKVTAATFGVSNDRATGGEGFDSGDAERFEAGKKVGAGVLEVGGKLGSFEPRDEGDKGRVLGKLD